MRGSGPGSDCEFDAWTIWRGDRTIYDSTVVEQLAVQDGEDREQIRPRLA